MAKLFRPLDFTHPDLAVPINFLTTIADKSLTQAIYMLTEGIGIICDGWKVVDKALASFCNRPRPQSLACTEESGC